MRTPSFPAPLHPHFCISSASSLLPVPVLSARKTLPQLSVTPSPTSAHQPFLTARPSRVVPLVGFQCPSLVTLPGVHVLSICVSP